MALGSALKHHATKRRSNVARLSMPRVDYLSRIPLLFAGLG